MVTTVSASELTVADAIEATWCFWISALQHWERRFVLENELEFHDLFASGEWGWADLDATLKEHFTPSL
jgi:hypothetical protein